MNLRSSWSKLLVALSLVTGAFMAAFTITFVWPLGSGLNIDIDSSRRARAARNRDPYDLTSLRVLNRVLGRVNDAYVEPDRVHHKRMLIAGLNAIQRSVAPVLLSYEEGRPTFAINVNGRHREFHVDDVNSPWSLALHFREVFEFLQAELANEEDLDLRDVEYAAVNGMLSTLDPHSVLLTREVYEEMRMSTRGEFGGLGIVISIRDGRLTVIRPMPGTPAGRAGLARMDRIVKIGEESTLNMPLQEAVNRLRGAPGSTVGVWVVREATGGWAQPRRFDLTRAIIRIDSVESRMLGDGIGYIQIKSFQGNTYEDMRRALAQLHRQNLRGLVLDLRDNPGGLLEQAVRVADAFLVSGTIVRTSSSDPGHRGEEMARPEGTEPNYPMVVLVNGGSASASEIVAGALKNHDRAIVVGERTFGKGSVQELYEFRDDGSALKLTVAQYLTPGDVSIQGVGVAPDIAIDPMTVDREDMDLTISRGYLREADLAAHLTHERAREQAQPALVLRYYLPAETRQRLSESSPEELEENERESEFLTRFSSVLLAGARLPGRREILRDAQPALDRVRSDEMARASAELRRLGVDWSLGADQGPSEAAVEVSTSGRGSEANAGQPFEMRVRVTNRGHAPLYQLRASTKSDYRLFNGRELVFGKLAPGESREWSTTLGICETTQGRRQCTLPRDTLDRADAIVVEFAEAYGHAPAPAEVRTIVHALPRPQFAYSLQVADSVSGNGDGTVQRGEVAAVYMRVRNVGQGRTFETSANLRNLSGAGILLRDGRFEPEELEPGDERLIRFTFEVLQDFHGDEAKLDVSVTDIDLHESVSEKIVVPIGPPGSVMQLQPVSGRMTVRSGTACRERPSADSPVVARASGGAVALAGQARTASGPAQAHREDFIRVDLESGRPGWVSASDVVEQADPAQATGHLEENMNHLPPRLDVELGETLVTRSPTLTVRGRATDETRVRDMYVFVDARKVVYEVNGGSSPREAGFEAQVPLHGGMNYVTVFARENADIASRRIFVVRRDAPDGSLMTTPEHPDDGSSDSASFEGLSDPANPAD